MMSESLFLFLKKQKSANFLDQVQIKNNMLRLVKPELRYLLDTYNAVCDELEAALHHVT